MRSIPNKRTFNGKAYLLVDSGYPNRMKAKSDAVKMRQEGYNVRIVKDPGSRTYSLYRRHKTRFV